MVYLLLGIFSSTLVSVFMRIGETKIKNEMIMFMTNYLTCIFFSYLMMNKTHTLTGAPFAISLGIISGVLYLLGFVLLKTNIRYNGIVLASTFMKLGVLIPTIIAILFFKEIPKLFQVIGIIIALIAIIMIQFDKNSINKEHNATLLLLVLLVSGITDSMANIYDKLGVNDSKDLYLLVTFFVAFLCASFISFKRKEKIRKEDCLFGFIIGIPNYFSSRFLLLSLAELDAIIVYPVFSVATLICITIVGVLIFKEKLSLKKVISLFLILVSLCLLNL